ncbi:Acetylcholine receptor subunit alpha-type acr-16 [Folsomia candida]|uniref:Acetylcholine receptor subunit alpha-type acr-16 n=1 Tax=Folsomia candida TaxID=158441 RepID=A0A226DR99_FOLCA|nr:Acetylcholine receptor subunit alpha-type acr-16 [Folsomia candida]
MAVLGFTLPPDSGEKLSLGVTILLSLTLFLNMVAETMPETSDAVPLLGTYFNCIMFMVASSVVSTVLVLNYHHRAADTHEMPEWIRVLLLQWLPWLLRMSRPNDRITLMTIAASAQTRDEMRELEMKDMCSQSLMANVLDMDDDLRPTAGQYATQGYRFGGSQHRAPFAGDHCPFLGRREVSQILKEIRIITKKLREVCMPIIFRNQITCKKLVECN